MLKIAVTGGIGTGKTAVTDYLKLRGFEIIDADEVSHLLTAPGGRAIPYIIENFGEDYLLPDGGLNRKKMGDLVFADSEKLALLEKGTTDRVIEVIEELLEEKAAAGCRVVFAGIPLLFEKNLQDNFNFVWLVSTEESIRIKRLCKRDGITEEEARLRISKQMDEAYKAANSDEIIDNSGSFEELYEKISKLLLKYDLTK